MPLPIRMRDTRRDSTASRTWCRRPDAEGAALSRRAREFWSKDWAGESFMAIGMKDPVLGPSAMRALRATIRNCPPPLELAEAGHFTQEAGVIVVEKAMASFSSG